MKRFLNSFTPLIIIFIFNIPILAQEQDTMKVYELKPMTVTAPRYSRTTNLSHIATKIPLAIQKTPVSIEVITQRVLEEQQATTLSDALENCISINVQNSLGTEDYFLIRGFESTSAGLVLIDGAIAPNVSPFKFYGFGPYNLYNVEQVEVLKGPAAFLYGGNTLSGAINLLRKQPQFRNFDKLSISHGRFGSYRESFDMNFGNYDAGYAFRLNGLCQVTGNFRKHTRGNIYALNPVITLKPNVYSSLTINLEYKQDDIKPDVGIPLYNPEGEWQLPDVPPTTSYQTDFDKSIYDNFRLRIDYHRDFTSQCQLKNKFYATHLNGKSRFTLPLIPYRKVGIAWVVPRHMYTIKQQQLVLGNQLELYQTWDRGEFKHNILLGLDIAITGNATGLRTTILNDVQLFNPIESVTDFDDLWTFQYQTETNTSQCIVASYLVDYISFSETYYLFCGGRLDFIDFDTDRQNAPFDYINSSISSKPIPFSRSYIKFSPLLGLVIRESENLWFYANAGRAFGSGTRIIDEPEFSTQYEVGFKYKTKDDRFKTSACIYSLQKENMSIPLGSPLAGLYTSNGSQRSEGFEFELTTQPFREWYLSLKDSYTYAELINYNAITATDYGKLILKNFSGNVPVFVPIQILYLGLNKDFKNGFVFGVGLRHVSDQYVNFENDYEIGSYMTYNALISYQLRNWRLQLNVEKISKTDLLSRGLGPYSVVPVVPLEIYGLIEIIY
jgi:TonB-dependent siderophore receptor